MTIAAPVDGTVPVHTRRASGALAVVLAFAGLSLGSTMAKATGAPGAVVAFWRFLVGAALWHVLIAVRGVRRGGPRVITAQVWRQALVPGIAFGVNLSCFFSGADRTPIAHAEFISALAPLIMAPLAARLLRERVEQFVVVCGVVAIVGVALILGHGAGGGTSLFGDALVVMSMLAWVVYLLRSKSARRTIDTPSFMAAMSTVACLTTLPLAMASAGSPSAMVTLGAKAWLLVALLGIVAGMVSHGLIAWAHDRVAVGTISILQLGQPALGAVWAAMFLGESVVAVQVLGMLVVLVAVGAIAWRSTTTSFGRSAAS
ncbi:MAG: hypothetical protein JWM34_2390 [Ilumatobacteraceae bacterium]|nr:hypothetical protein [Ilumatobacteraceae bacterium]